MARLLDAGLEADAADAMARPPQRNWWKSAACQVLDTDAFFDDLEGGDAARACCERCPVRQDCLSEALRIPTLDGIWGGTDLAERNRLRRRLGLSGSLVFDEGHAAAPEVPPRHTPPTSAPAPTNGDSATPPDWVDLSEVTGARWAMLGAGPGHPGHSTLAGVEIVCRQKGPGAVVAYGRRRDTTAAVL